jgi:hypothetical protein
MHVSTHRRSACLAGLVLAAAVWGHTAGAQTNTDWRALLADRAFVRLKSNCGRFVVLGTNRVWAVHLLRWAREMTDEAERLTGLPMAFRGRTLEITLGDAGPDAARVTTVQAMTPAGLVQRLVIADYRGADLEEAEAGICRLLLGGRVADLALRGGTVPGGGTGGTWWDVPEWFYRGLARNLYPGLRADNAATVLGTWRTGRLPTLERLLNGTPPPGGEDRALYRAAWGLLIGLVRERPDEEAVFDRWVRLAAAGGKLDADAVAAALSGGRQDDLQEAWENWIVRQKRIVREPGVTAAADVVSLKNLLLVYPPEQGRAGWATGRVLALEYLVEHRGEDWVADVAREKALALQLLSAGRGEAFAAAAGVFVDFFTRLAAQEEPAELLRLLREGRLRLAALDAAGTAE